MRIKCPYCRKVGYNQPGSYECSDCKTKFIVNSENDIRIVESKFWKRIRIYSDSLFYIAFVVGAFFLPLVYRINHLNTFSNYQLKDLTDDVIIISLIILFMPIIGIARGGLMFFVRIIEGIIGPKHNLTKDKEVLGRLVKYGTILSILLLLISLIIKSII